MARMHMAQAVHTLIISFVSTCSFERPALTSALPSGSGVVGENLRCLALSSLKVLAIVQEKSTLVLPTPPVIFLPIYSFMPC